MTVPSTALPLLCHPTKPCPLALQLVVTLNWHADGLVLHYRVRGAVDGIRVPHTTDPARADGLWQHTCMEAFVSPVQSARYREYNFSPSLQWAAYSFMDERQRDTAAEATEASGPSLRVEATSGEVNLWAVLPEAALPAGPRLCLGLSAVIETRSGHLSYWALQHPRPDRPDFHHRGGWREMPRPSAGPGTT